MKLKTFHSVLLVVTLGASLSVFAFAEKIDLFEEKSCPGNSLTEEAFYKLIPLPDATSHDFGSFSIYYRTRTCYPKFGGKCKDSAAPGLYFKPSFDDESHFFNLKGNKGLVSIELIEDKVSLKLTGVGEEFNSLHSAERRRDQRVTSFLSGASVLSSGQVEGVPTQSGCGNCGRSPLFPNGQKAGRDGRVNPQGERRDGIIPGTRKGLVLGKTDGDLLVVKGVFAIGFNRQTGKLDPCLSGSRDFREFREKIVLRVCLGYARGMSRAKQCVH